MVHLCPECSVKCYCDFDDSNDASQGECFHRCDFEEENPYGLVEHD